MFKYLVLLLLLISTSQGSVTYVAVNEYGLAEVTHIIPVSSVETTVKLIGKPIENIVIVVDEHGLPLSYTLNDTVLIVETYGVDLINVTYLTYDVVKMEGGVWTIKFTSEAKCELTIPQSSSITYINVIPEEIRTVDERICLILAPGTYEVEYIIPPQLLPSTSLTSPLATPTPTSAPPTYNFILLIVIVSTIILITIVAIILKTRGKSARLSDVESLILDYLKSKSGGAYQEDIVKDLKLPQSTASRAINSLIKKGFVETRKIARRNYVKIK